MASNDELIRYPTNLEMSESSHLSSIKATASKSRNILSIYGRDPIDQI